MHSNIVAFILQNSLRRCNFRGGVQSQRLPLRLGSQEQLSQKCFEHVCKQSKGLTGCCLLMLADVGAWQCQPRSLSHAENPDKWKCQLARHRSTNLEPGGDSSLQLPAGSHLVFVVYFQRSSRRGHKW